VDQLSELKQLAAACFWKVLDQLARAIPYNPLLRRCLKRLLEANGYREVVVQNATPALWMAHSAITYFFSAEGKKNRSLRNPILVLFFMTIARFIMFPALWMGNKLGRGDCLLVTATKHEEVDVGRE